MSQIVRQEMLGIFGTKNLTEERKKPNIQD